MRRCGRCVRVLYCANVFLRRAVPRRVLQVETDKVIRIRFENVGKLPPPVLQFTQVGKGAGVC